MTQPVRVAHFINQFFAGLGGQEASQAALEVREGPVGPGKALEAALAGQGQVVATLVCGDGYFNDHADAVLDEAVRGLQPIAPDVVVTGPAFDSGVYGLNCARLGNVAAERLGLPVVSGMFPENRAWRSGGGAPTSCRPGARPARWARRSRRWGR